MGLEAVLPGPQNALYVYVFMLCMYMYLAPRLGRYPSTFVWAFGPNIRERLHYQRAKKFDD